MSLENGKCPCCNGALMLDSSRDKVTCKYCGHEIVIQQAVQKCAVDGIATFDTLMLGAQQAIDYDKDYDLARKRYKEALRLSPSDYRVLWGIYLCEVETLKWYLNTKGYVGMEGDMMEYVNDAKQRYGQHAQSLAPDDVKPYYFQVINQNHAFFEEEVAKRKKKSGCYVATAVYGSYDCPQVWTLRRYRDNTLAKTWYGRAFIRTYYAVSPTLVKWFGKTNWFKKLWKGKLDRMVNKLQSQGVESTPYKDRNW